MARVRTPAAGHGTEAQPRGSATDLKARWPRLHRGDREPFPSAAGVARLAAAHAPLGALLERCGGAPAVAQGLQRAWSAFHAGRFLEAIRLADGLGALGACAANKSAAVYSLQPSASEREAQRLLEQAAARGEDAVQVLPDHANAHFTLALALGRYSQRVSIARALSEGFAGRVRTHLDRALELEPRHAEAHVALGLYHAEIVAQLGALAARIVYGANREAAQQHFERALKLTPDSPVVLMEYAYALRRLDARAHDARVRELYRRAAACAAEDAMERLDRERSARELASL